MKDKSAIKPTHFVDIRNIKSLRTREKIEEGNLDPEQGLLHAIADTPGWEVLEEFILDVKSDLDDLTKTQMENGATTEQIGSTAITVLLVKEVLDKVLNKVNDAEEAIEKEITKGPKGEGKQ